MYWYFRQLRVSTSLSKIKHKLQLRELQPSERSIRQELVFKNYQE